MRSMDILYKQGEEFKHLDVQKSIDSVTAPVINKAAIRKEATGTLRLLFEVIKLNHSFTKDEVWLEMADEVKGLCY